MNRLTQIEAARVVSVLSVTLDKLTTLLDLHLELITPEIPPEFVPEHILTELNKHKELELKFNELVEQGKELKQTAHRAKIKENQNEIREISDKIKQSSQNLERLLSENPETMEQLRLLGTRSDTAKQYLEIFDQLVKLSKIRLETSVEEELETIKRMEVLAARESKVQAEMTSLRKELEAEEKTRAKDVQQIRDNEQRLNAQIQKMEQNNTQFEARCEADLKTMSQQLMEEHKERIEELHRTNERLTNELQMVLEENRLRERESRKSKQQTGQEIENRISGYDQGMLEKRNAHIRAEEKLADERKEIKELEGKVEEMEKRKMFDRFEHELKRKQEEHLQAEKDERERKISIIQALYRRRQAIKQGEQLKRVAARKKGKGKKKGKK
ncbi:hypothetical protein BLNAU_1775 [Blattamonas nauphoetae]|uniref:Dynein regulatory complex protein 10 n=1 Tax=Blattamonas nauphoetae TaxID=2049346 RepID=A0ABQ9YHK9_9EUKA|nr:hypothetical protein BLNAU_1775 [Blattamonas nauphoetae]